MVVAEWCSANLRDEAVNSGALQGTGQQTHCLQGWQAAKMSLHTTSGESARMYDASVRQVVSWLDEDTLGGIESTLERMLAVDPKFGVHNLCFRTLTIPYVK